MEADVQEEVTRVQEEQGPKAGRLARGLHLQQERTGLNRELPHTPNTRQQPREAPGFKTVGPSQQFLLSHKQCRGLDYDKQSPKGHPNCLPPPQVPLIQGSPAQTRTTSR